MTKRVRRRFSPEYTEQAVARLSDRLTASYGIVDKVLMLGVTATQLKTWKLELRRRGLTRSPGDRRAQAWARSQWRTLLQLTRRSTNG